MVRNTFNVLKIRGFFFRLFFEITLIEIEMTKKKMSCLKSGFSNNTNLIKTPPIPLRPKIFSFRSKLKKKKKNTNFADPARNPFNIEIIIYAIENGNLAIVRESYYTYRYIFFLYGTRFRFN